MSAMASQITASRLFTQPFIQARMKENIKAPRHWILWREFTDDRWIPTQMASNAENISTWWRHHGINDSIPWMACGKARKLQA